jgi:hypothetical protein
MTLVIITASVITGVFGGWWLCLVVATTAMSRSQQHMEKRVRYWQAQVRAPRAGADEWEMESAVPSYWPQA